MHTSPPMPISLRDLADTLGVTIGALKHHKRQGKIPVTKIRNQNLVDYDTAQQIIKWHSQNNRLKTWPVFPLTNGEQDSQQL